MTATARRTLFDADQGLTHVTELIAARDFRRLGWVLVGNGAGDLISSIAGLTLGADLTLSFHDGRASATVTTIHPNPGGAITHG